MIPPITRSRNVRSFVPLNFTVLYVVCRFPLISDREVDLRSDNHEIPEKGSNPENGNPENGSCMSRLP